MNIARLRLKVKVKGRNAVGRTSSEDSSSYIFNRRRRCTKVGGPSYRKLQQKVCRKSTQMNVIQIVTDRMWNALVRTCVARLTCICQHDQTLGSL